MSRKPKKRGKVDVNTDINKYMETSETDISNASVEGRVVQFEENKTPLPVKPADTNAEIVNIFKDLSNKVKGLTQAICLNTTGSRRE